MIKYQSGHQATLLAWLIYNIISIFHGRTPHKSGDALRGKKIYPHQDSNLGLSLRRAALYPLSYEGMEKIIAPGRPDSYKQESGAYSLFGYLSLCGF